MVLQLFIICKLVYFAIVQPNDVNPFKITYVSKSNVTNLLTCFHTDNNNNASSLVIFGSLWVEFVFNTNY